MKRLFCILFCLLIYAGETAAIEKKQLCFYNEIRGMLLNCEATKGKNDASYRYQCYDKESKKWENFDPKKDGWTILEIGEADCNCESETVKPCVIRNEAIKYKTAPGSAEKITATDERTKNNGKPSKIKIH